MTFLTNDPRALQSDDLSQWMPNLQYFLNKTAGVPSTTPSFPDYQQSTVAASAALSGTTETVISAPLVLVPGTTLRIGTIVRFIVQGTCTSSVANVSTFTIRAGILGTIADASVATAAVTAATSGTGVAFEVVIQGTVQTLAATGTMFGSMKVQNTGVTGIAAVTNTVVPFTSSTLATTTATAIELTYKSAASTTACTFQNVTGIIIP